MANRLYKPVYQIWPTRNLIGEFGSGKAAHLAPQGPLGPVLTQWQNLWHKVAEHSGKGQAQVAQPVAWARPAERVAASFFAFSCVFSCNLLYKRRSAC